METVKIAEEAKLDDAIRTVLVEPVPSAVARQVLDRAKSELQALGARHQAVRSAALDPRGAPAAVEKARRELHDLTFEQERLTIAVDELAKRVVERRDAEQAEARASEYEAARAERDTLAAELKDRFPALFAEMIGLFERLEASDDRLRAANERSGRPYLASAEAIARGTAPNLMFGGQEVMRLTTIRIPNFAEPGLAWPTRTF